MTHDTNFNTAFRKANECLLHDNCKTQVRFQRASHVESGNLSPNKTVRNTYNWRVKVRLSYAAILVTLTQSLTLRSATGSTTPKPGSTRTITEHVRPVVTEGLDILRTHHSPYIAS